MAAPKDAGSIYSDVRIRLDKLTADLQAVNTGFGKLGKSLQTQSTNTEKKLTANFKNIGIAGVAAIGVITVAFKKAITVFADTEQKLANVKAVSNATAEDFKLLEEAARDAGTTTRFTAGQAADALFFLSSAGLDAKESIAALDGVLTLAGATGSDLASTAQTVTATLSQFDLASEKSTDVANIFAAANSNSQATLEKLSGALRQVGPVAAGLNIGLEETVGSLQALFNAGFQGESAGRALKSALADLANEASPTIEKLNKLGIAFEDVDPTAVGLTGAIGALEESGITAAQTIEAFGKVAGPQLITLIKSGEAALTDYEKAVTGTNEAARQYAEQNDTLAGSIDAFKSAAEGAGNSAIETLAPALRSLIDLAAGFLRFTVEIPSALKGFIVAGGAATTVALALGKALSFMGIALGGPLGAVALVATFVVGLSNIARLKTEKELEKLTVEFGDMAKEIGLTGSAVDEFIEKVANIESLLELDLTTAFSDVVLQVDSLAEGLELSKLEVINIGLESKKVSDEYKTQLLALKEQITEQQIINELSDDSLLLNEKISLRKIEQARASAEQKRIADELSKSEQDRIDRLGKISSEIEVLDELSSRGAISEIDLLEQKKALREEEIAILVDQAVTSEDVSDQIIADINKQQQVVNVYNERLKVLNEEQEKREKDLSDSTKKEYKARVLTYEQTLKDSEFAHRSFTEKVEENEETLTENLADNWESYTGTIVGLTTSLVNSLVGLRVAEADAEIAQIERIRDADLEALDLRTQATLEANGLLEETKLESLQRQLDKVNEVANNETEATLNAIDIQTQALLESLGIQEDTKIESLEKRKDKAVEAGEEETAQELQNEIDRTVILQAAEDEKQIIKDAAEKTQRDNEIAETAAQLQDQIDREVILLAAEEEKNAILLASEKEAAKIKYDADIAQWKNSKLNTIAIGAQAAISAYGALAGIPIIGPGLGIAAGVAVGVATGVQVAAIEKAKPVANFQTGGVVLPSDGGTMINTAENGSPEFVANLGESGNGVVNLLASKLSDKIGGGQPTVIQLFMDSKQIAKGVAQNFNNGIVKVILK